MLRRSTPLILVSLVSVLTACKAEMKDLLLVAPEGSTLEVRILPQNITQTLTGTGKEVRVSVNAEVEQIVLLATHAENAQMGSPTLKVELSPSGAGKEFEPHVDKTSLSPARSNGAESFAAECKNLVSASGQGGMVAIEVRPPLTVGDCEDKNLRLLDPLYSGRNRKVGEGSNYFSEADDRRMGMDFVRDFQNKNGHLIVRDQSVQNYLDSMMTKIAINSDAPDVKPQVHFVNADIVNAFALPGGPVYVFRGIMESVRDEHELIGILGHEWAHVAARHGTKNVTRAINGQIAVLTAVIALEMYKLSKYDESYRRRVRASLIADAAKVATLVGSQLILMGGSRDAEREADQLGAQYAYRIGFNPLGIGDFFDALARGGSSSVAIESLLSSHPDHRERVDNNAELVRKYFPGNSLGLPRGSAEFASVRDSLKYLPPMVRGQEANRAIARGFLETNQELSYKEVNRVLGNKFN